MVLSERATRDVRSFSSAIWLAKSRARCGSYLATRSRTSSRAFCFWGPSSSPENQVRAPDGLIFVQDEKKESSAPKPPVNGKCVFELKVVMKTEQNDVLNFSAKESTIFNILGGILDESKFKVLYGRGYTFCRLCLRTIQDVKLVMETLNGKIFEVPKKVTLSVELMDKKEKKSDNGKPVQASEASPEAASVSSRYVKVIIVSNDSQEPEIIPPHEASFLMFAFSAKTDKFPVNIKICHHILKRDFLLLKLDSVQNAEVAVQKMNGQDYFYGENHFKSLHTLQATFTGKF